eukprot:Rhum_TRINITY_DN23484_c0_g1::Rhum_TRINITY_DN23484_c0_g1_i1::g.178091::m.178091
MPSLRNLHPAVPAAALLLFVFWVWGGDSSSPPPAPPQATATAPSGDEDAAGCVAPVFAQKGGACEGWWSEELPPVPHDKPWCGKAAFVRRLREVEALAGVEGSGVTSQTQRGLAQSRLDDEWLGNVEFHDTQEKVCWTGDLREHYVGKHNVVPSRAFVDYVVSRARGVGGGGGAL